MIYYSLIRSSSNEVISIFEWDEIASGSVTGSITFPSGTYLQEVSASASFTSSADYNDFVNVGVFSGFFTGSIVGTYANFDTLNVNNVFVLYQPSGSNTGSLNIGTTGSLSVSGSVNANDFSGSFSGSFNGYLNGTASYTLSSSHAQTSELANTSSFSIISVLAYTSSLALIAKLAETGSQIETIVKTADWTPPFWAKKIKVVCIGGGGGGGSAPADEDGITSYCGGGGGGGGTVTIGEFKIEDIGTGSIPIMVGAGGNGGIAQSNGLGGWNSYDGLDGGATLFGNYLVALGGRGGIKGKAQDSVPGGLPRASVNYTNTGGGPGGRGSETGFTVYVGVQNECIPPDLPMSAYYLQNKWYFFEDGFGTIPIPSNIAPTGGGGGLGITQPGNIRNNGYTIGGNIGSIYNFNEKIVAVPYNSSSYEYYPAFNAKIGLGGKGGNPYLLEGPTHGRFSGGGGGGAYAGGVTGSYSNGYPNGTPYNFGANGARGSVIIISET